MSTLPFSSIAICFYSDTYNSNLRQCYFYYRFHALCRLKRFQSFYAWHLQFCLPFRIHKLFRFCRFHRYNYRILAFEVGLLFNLSWNGLARKPTYLVRVHWLIFVRKAMATNIHGHIRNIAQRLFQILYNDSWSFGFTLLFCWTWVHRNRVMESFLDVPVSHCESNQKVLSQINQYQSCGISWLFEVFMSQRPMRELQEYLTSL